MAAKKSAKKVDPARIDAVRHKDKRKNIPTEELRDFVADDEQNPRKILYPRNPDLDPQLVWKGKDQQDNEPLEVPAVPIYIQEKIHPQAIIDDFKRSAAQPEDERDTQLTLFSDFNGLPDDFDKRVDFYHHEGNWSNRLILGNSLLAMTSLAEKEGLKGKVQMVYMDPPYGIKFGSNWQVSTRKRDVKDGNAGDVTRQPEQVQAFRDTWKLGIHSYLPYLRDRMVVARDLLTESGSIFVQIGDENVHLVRCLLDEVFGRENFIAQIATAKTSGQSDSTLAQVADFVLWYARNVNAAKTRKLFQSKDLGGEGASKYSLVEFADGTRTTVAKAMDQDGNLPSDSRAYRLSDMTSTRPSQPGDVPSYVFKGRVFSPGKRTFRTDRKGLDHLAVREGLRQRQTPSRLCPSWTTFLSSSSQTFGLTSVASRVVPIRKCTWCKLLSELFNAVFS